MVLEASSTWRYVNVLVGVLLGVSAGKTWQKQATGCNAVRCTSSLSHTVPAGIGEGIPVKSLVDCADIAAPVKVKRWVGELCHDCDRFEDGEEFRTWSVISSKCPCLTVALWAEK